jgi:homocysteine S-methyltransferase
MSISAGADVILTNTYQASINGFVKYLNASPEDGLSLIYTAVDLAKQARDIFLEEYIDAGI